MKESMEQAERGPGLPVGGPGPSPSRLERLLARYDAAETAIDQNRRYVLDDLGYSPETLRLVSVPRFSLGEAHRASRLPGGEPPRQDGGPRGVRRSLKQIRSAARTRAAAAGLMLEAGLRPGRWQKIGGAGVYIEVPPFAGVPGLPRDAGAQDRQDWRLHRAPWHPLMRASARHDPRMVAELASRAARPRNAARRAVRRLVALLAGWTVGGFARRADGGAATGDERPRFLGPTDDKER